LLPRKARERHDTFLDRYSSLNHRFLFFPRKDFLCLMRCPPSTSKREKGERSKRKRNPKD